MAAPEIDEFKVARQRAAEQSQARVQQRNDALTRRYAQLGNLNSGSRLKQEQIAQNEESQNLRDQNQNIDVSEQAEMRRRREKSEDQAYASGEAEKGRSFATSERLGGQSYASGENSLQRRYQTGEREAGQGFESSERVAGQTFAGDQASLARRFATSERLGGQEYASGEAGKQREYVTSERLGGQEYASGENALQRRYTTGEREAGQKYATTEALAARSYDATQRGLDRTLTKQGMAQQKEQAAEQLVFARSQMTQAAEQFEKTFGLESEAQKINIAAAEKEANAKKGGLMAEWGSKITRGVGGSTNLGISIAAPVAAAPLYLRNRFRK